ncbi:unnamed protein product [Fusarium equiseti]|uniref:Ankyrin n=1 Tax=Fusarium equiseti TaxID=61235 RepID=A0A8J2NEP5_FUSEQ|nr:unnamed protein product [Fusarium equiseti]
MASPKSDSESPYHRYRRDPTEIDADGNQGDWRPSPLRIIDRDGSVLFEWPELDLRTDIILANDVEMLQQYLDAAPWAIEAPGPEDSSADPFFVAAQSGRVEALQALLAHHSKINGPSEKVRFLDRRVDLLSTAARWGGVEMVRFLLDNQPLYADIHELDSNEETAILSAANSIGTSYIDWLGKQEVCLDNSEAVMHLLLDRGACASDSLERYDEDPECQTSETVLTLAVQWAGSELIQRLIDNGADVHAKIVYKVDFTPRLEYKDWFVHVTALSIASLHANSKAVELLISNRGNGVDITDMTSRPDSQGRLPIHWASQCHLTRYPSAILASRMLENAESVMYIIKLLLDKDPKTINVQDNSGDTPLHYAALFYGRLGKQHTPILRFLCDRGADASIRNVYGETPLRLLFKRGWGHSPVDTMAIETLLAHGAKPTDTDVYGNTALHYAAWFPPFSEAVSCLIKHGADVKIRNLCQETALHSVADSPYWGDAALRKNETAEQLFKDQEAMVAELLEAGGVEMMDQPNREGKSPRQIIREWKEYARELQAYLTAIDNGLPWKDRPQINSSRDRSGRGRRRNGTCPRDMAPSLPPNAESPYKEFRHEPDNRYRSPIDVPVTLTDHDGTLIHEPGGYTLLNALIAHDDVKLVRRYFAIDPLAIPNYFDLPDGDEAFCDMGIPFRRAAESGSLGILKLLLDYTTKNLDATTPRRLQGAGFQLLNVAARFGRVKMVQWLLDNQPLYADIHDRDWQGYTALASAANLFELDRCYAPRWEDICFDNSEATMNLLLDHGACASVVARTEDDEHYKGPSVLTMAAPWASSDLLERLIDGGADVQYKVATGSWRLDFGNQRDFPPAIEVNSLFLASLYANPDGIKTLVDRRGVGVDVADTVCSTDCVGALPLHWAARSQIRHIPAAFYVERAGRIRRTIEQLLDFAPTTINVQDNDGNTALHYATRQFGKHGSTFTPILQLLCARGADASLRNYNDETPLHTLFQPHGDDGLIDIAAVSLLLSHGAKVTDLDEPGNTPLHIATRDWQFIDAVALLLEYGADPARKNLKQENALPKKMEYLLGSK